jgi:hypothetical protein
MPSSLTLFPPSSTKEGAWKPLDKNSVPKPKRLEAEVKTSITTARARLGRRVTPTTSVYERQGATRVEEVLEGASEEPGDRDRQVRPGRPRDRGHQGLEERRDSRWSRSIRARSLRPSRSTRPFRHRLPITLSPTVLQLPPPNPTPLLALPPNPRCPRSCPPIHLPPPPMPTLPFRQSLLRPLLPTNVHPILSSAAPPLVVKSKPAISSA